MERRRLRGRDDVGDRHRPVLPLVVATASAAGRTQHPPRAERSGDRSVHTLGQGQAKRRNMAGPLGWCCRAGSPCPYPLGGWAHPPRRAGPASLGGQIRANLLVLGQQSGASILVRDSHPAAGLACNLTFGCLHVPSRSRCLTGRAVMLLELAHRPAQGGSFPPSTADRARCDAGVVERLVGRLSALRTVGPRHPHDSTAAGARPDSGLPSSFSSRIP